MYAVVDTVVPVFGLLAIGFLAGRLGYVSDAAAKGLPEFVFRIAMPVMLMRTIGSARPPSIPVSDILVAFFAAVAAVWILATLATRFVLARPAADASAIGMGSAFSNSVNMGIPIALAHFGPDAAPIIAVLILCDTPAMWFAATLQLAASEKTARTGIPALIGNLVRRLATNPIILGAVAGFVVQITGVTFPPLLDRMISMLAMAAVPGALVAMGLALNSYGLKGQISAVVLVSTLKLLVMPVVAWLVAVHVLAMPPLAAGVVVLLAAMPVGANAYLFASAYDRAPAVVSGAIALSTPVSLATLIALLLMLPR